MCESTVCAPGLADVNSDGVCETTVCAMLRYDANSDGLCELTTCAGGSADINSDGTCEPIACAEGFFDVDSDSVCEAVDCPQGHFDIDSDGVCEATICPIGNYDADSDGECEPVVCGPGFAEVDSDGICEETICTGGKYDTDSDGVCEDVSFTLLLTPSPFGVLSAGEVIPVTGGVMSELSCTEANTLVLPNGGQAAFSASLCGYQAGLTEISKSSLIGPLPEGLTFVSGLTLLLQNGSTAVSSLPASVTVTVNFAVDEALSGKTLVVLMWDSNAKSWVETSTAEAEQASFTTAGTYVLAYK